MSKSKITVAKVKEEFDIFVQNVSADLQTIANAVKNVNDVVNKLDNKVNVLAEVSGQTNALKQALIDASVKAMKQQVDALIQANQLRNVGDTPADENSFVVGEELNKNNEVINPRIQFLLSQIKEDFRAKIIGSKAGDVILLDDDAKFVIKEVYGFGLQETAQ